MKQRLPEIARNRLARKQRVIYSAKNSQSIQSCVPEKWLQRSVSWKFNVFQNWTETNENKYAKIQFKQTENRLPQIGYPNKYQFIQWQVNLIKFRDNRIIFVIFSHYNEILQRFPEILSITGNAINQRKKQG